MLVLEPMFALIIPSGNLESTLEEPTQLADADPAHCITAIKWRKSCHGGRPWA